MIRRLISLMILSISMLPQMKAQEYYYETENSGEKEFFDKGHPDQLFNIGFRLGFNTSDRSFPDTPLTQYNNSSWGLGFDAGVVVSLNIRDYLSIQPGFFFESRSGNYNMLFWYIDYFNKNQDYYTLGHYRTFNFTVPVMAVMKFNVASNVKWSVELGPYLQFILKNQGKEIQLPYMVQGTNTFDSYYAKRNSFDFGIKMGSGLTFANHYYFGIHYLAGVCNAYKNPAGGRNKAWTFTIGYEL